MVSKLSCFLCVPVPSVLVYYSWLFMVGRDNRASFLTTVKIGIILISFSLLYATSLKGYPKVSFSFMQVDSYYGC